MHLCGVMDSRLENGVTSDLDDEMTHQENKQAGLTGGNQRHLPFWESGSGYYGNTLGFRTRLILRLYEDFTLSYVDKVPVKGNEVFTIGDYGANDGYGSMHLFCRMIHHMREKHGGALPVRIIYEDQEMNDFNSLFKRMQGKGSPTSEFENVYCLATNTNFYKQCVPDKTFHVILTSIAAHWLESMETTFKNSVFHIFATKEEKRSFQREAEQSWTKFLLLRARELKPGGILIAFNLSAPDEAIYEENLNQTNSSDDHNGQKIAVQATTQRDVFADMEAAWRQLKEDKVISQEEYEGCSSMQAVRTAKEITAPFERVNSPVRQAGLTLVYHDQMLQQNFFLSPGTENCDSEDRHQFAERLCKAHRVWSQTTFESSLSHKRSAEEKSAIMDCLYREMERRVRDKNPENYRDEILVSRLVVRKV